MTIVDLAKARAFADVVAESEAEAADWIRELADEAASLERTAERAQTSEQAALADAARLLEERDAAVSALVDLYAAIGSMISNLPKGN